MLNVRHNEKHLVRNLFAIEFFQGAGIAFFFTSAFALFLQSFSVNELPKVFILSAFMLWGINIIYSRFELRLKSTRLAPSVTVLMAISILLFRLGCIYIHGSWYWYFMLAWYYVLYLLNGLEFWGIASLLFDVRQSKRLFGVISAGDIPVKFIGYSLASIVVTYIGTANLLYAGFIFMLFSLPFIRMIAKTYYPQLNLKHYKDFNKKPSQKIFKSYFKNFIGNQLIERITILAFLFGICWVIANFAFYAELKTAFHKDVDLAKFIALFLAASRIFALIMKIIFTGRMMTKLGFKRSLVFTPLVITAFIFMILFSKYVLQSEKLIFYIFGMLAIAVDLLRSSVHYPVFLSLMQPLPTHERLRAHNIVKGIMDPFAYLVTGIMLWALILFFHHADLIVLSYIILGIIIIFIIEIYRINKPYLQTLIYSISSRFFNEEDVIMAENESVEQITEKLETGTDLEKIYILKLLEKSPFSIKFRDLIIHSLNDSSFIVKSESLRIIDNQKITEAIPFLRKIIENNSDSKLTAGALKVLCNLEFNENEILPLINHPDPDIQQSAIISVFTQGNDQAVLIAENKLTQFVYSDNSFERIEAAIILGEINNERYEKLIIKLINDDDKKVRQQAILSAGKISKKELLEELILHLNLNETDVIEAFYEAGDRSLPVIKNYLLSKNYSRKQAGKLLLLCGRINGEKTCNVLSELLNELPDLVFEIIQALYKCHYNAGLTGKEKIEKLIDGYFNTAHEIINIRQLIYPLKEEYQLLDCSLKIELHEIKKYILYLFSFLYGNEVLKKIQIGFITGKKESIANSLELIEITIPKKFSAPFIHIFETEDNFYYTHSKSIDKSAIDMQPVFHTILMNECFSFNEWTKACCLYSGMNNNLYFHKNIIKKYIDSNNILLKEIVLSAIKI